MFQHNRRKTMDIWGVFCLLLFCFVFSSSTSSQLYLSVDKTISLYISTKYNQPAITMDHKRVQHNRMKTIDSWSVFCFDSLAPVERQEEGNEPIRFKSGWLPLTTPIINTSWRRHSRPIK